MWRMPVISRSEEHTSELQSLRHLVCRLLLEKKKKKTINTNQTKPKRSNHCEPLSSRRRRVGCAALALTDRVSVVWLSVLFFFFFFFNDTATTEIYTLSLHDALPIWKRKYTTAELRSRFGPEFERA